MKFIDLFAGIGGIRTPFQEFGLECVFSSEWDKYSQITYEANFGEKPNGDITLINEKEIPKFDILTGGFPCQAFSIAGKKRGFEDTRGTLFFDIARIIKHHQPKSFLLENVKGLLGHDKKKTFQLIYDTLTKELGYHVTYKVLNAKDFGVPQNRERIYIVGFKDETDFNWPEPIKQDVKLGDILEKDIDEYYTLTDHQWNYHQNRKQKMKDKGYGFGYSLFNEESSYTSTISARYYKDGSEIFIDQKDKNPRKLTPREAARLQGFKDDFIIPVSNTQAYKQFGNSVAIPVIRAISEEMLISLKYLTNNSSKKTKAQLKLKL